MKLWKRFHLSSTMAVDESSVRRKCDEITQLLILLISCTLSFLRSFIHSLPLPSMLPLGPVLPTFHPAPSFPTCSIFPVVLNQTQPPWLISQFFPTQFSSPPVLSLSYASSFQLAFHQSLLVTMLGDGEIQQDSAFMEAPGIAPGLLLAALP